MKFIRCTTIAVVEYIKEHLIAPAMVKEMSEIEQAEFQERSIEDLKLAIENMPPELLYISVCLADDEVLGFIIAYIVRGNLQHTYIQQLWTKTFEKQHYVSTSLFKRVVQWSENLGLNYICMDTSRSPEAWARAWKFKPVATTMLYDIAKNQRPDSAVSSEASDH
jgi:hypothetical protein